MKAPTIEDLVRWISVVATDAQLDQPAAAIGGHTGRELLDALRTVPTEPEVRDGDTVTAAQLKLGDVVRMDLDRGEAYSDATVNRIQKGQVRFFRPYVFCHDVIYTGGLITTVGMEEYEVAVDSPMKFRMVRRNRTPLR